ncbi:protein GVQW3-like [Palaemon carinicauda]|uniref:protein GVQW3-like n=1 Tax=Palaemon carinicauda TaxID=392227 RepID=UPI0035B5E451
MSKTQVFEWFTRFKSGQMSLEDQPCSERPSSSRKDENIIKIHELILEDHRRTIDELADLSGVSWSSCQRILDDELGMIRVAAKMVPCLLKDGQKHSRMDACRELKEYLEVDPDLFSKVITGDES